MNQCVLHGVDVLKFIDEYMGKSRLDCLQNVAGEYIVEDEQDVVKVHQAISGEAMLIIGVNGLEFSVGDVGYFLSL